MISDPAYLSWVKMIPRSYFELIFSELCCYFPMADQNIFDFPDSKVDADIHLENYNATVAFYGTSKADIFLSLNV